MTEMDFVVALFGLFMFAYCAIKLILSIPRTGGYEDREYDERHEGADRDYHV